MIGSILGGAFKLVGHRPGSVVIWALVYLVGIFAIGLLRVSMTPPGATGESVGGSLFASLVTQLLMLGLIAVLLTAVSRATLHPYKIGTAYLRFGGNEWRVFLLLLMLTIGTAIAAVLLVLLSQLLLWGLAVLVGPVATGLLGQFIAWLVVAALLIWVQVRLSVALPLTYLYEQITVDEAWTMSRGHFWSLFGAFVAIGVLLTAGWMVVMLLFFRPVLSALVHANFGPDTMFALMMMMVYRAVSLPVLAQVTIIAMALILVALGFVLTTATLASAARELLGLQDGQLPDLSRRTSGTTAP